MPLVTHVLKVFRAFTFIFTLGKQSLYIDVKVSRSSLQPRLELSDVFKLSHLISNSRNLNNSIEVLLTIYF